MPSAVSKLDGISAYRVAVAARYAVDVRTVLFPPFSRTLAGYTPFDKRLYSIV